MSTIAKVLYLFFIWLDKVTGNYESYSYETAPYCGHAHDGHDGFFTRSHFHESDGGGETHGWFHRYILGVWFSNVDGYEYGFHVPVYLWFRWFYFETKHWLKNLVFKIDYPLGKRTLYINVKHFRSRRERRLGYSLQKKLSTLHIIRLRGFVPVSHSTIII